LRDRFISSQRFIKVYLLTRLSFSRRLTLVVFGLASLLVFTSVFNFNYSFTFTTNAQAAGTPGTVDLTFDPGSGANGVVYALAVQGDGKVLIGGDFTAYNGTARNRIARLNNNGTLDTTFNPGTGVNGTVWSLAVQSDGKILIGGAFTTFNDTARNGIARLNSNGTLDTTFNPGTGIGGGDFLAVYAIAVQSDGKILIGGAFTTFNGTNRNGIARLNSNGTLDTTFNPGIGADDGSTVFAVTVQGDGKVLIGGFFSTYDGTARNKIARLNNNGTLDTTFNPGIGVNDGSTVFAVTVQGDGKVLIGGDFTAYNGTARNRIARLNNNGTLDTTFNPGNGANRTVWALTVQGDGKIVIGGEFTAYNGTNRNRIARLNNNGTLDTTFNPGDGADRTVWALTVQGDGKIVIGGDFTNVDFIARNKIARLETCNALEVTAISDDGVASTCGTLSFALLTATSGQTITFALTQGNTITFTGGLTPTVPAGVTIDGGGGGGVVGGANGSGITLEGSGVAGNGLRLSGGNTLTNLTIRHFGGQELVIPLLSPNNRLSKVRLVS
jgi:uncharacterized delta-60 repeat protein